MDVGSERLKVVYSTDCIRYPLTGIGRYAYELAKELQRPERNLELLYLHGLKIGHLLTEPAESAPSAQSLKRHLKNSKLVSDIYRLTIPTMKSFLLKKREDAVFHSPNYYIPSGVRRSIATFHDLSVFHWPQFHPAGRVHLLQKELKNTVNRATMLITDSEYTKGEISDYFNYDSARIIVAPLACNNDFHPRKECDVRAVLKQYQLKWRKFFLYTGTIEPRKNIITLLRAYDKLTLQEKLEYPLVISGYKGWENEALFTLFDKGKSEGWLTYLGYVSGKDLPLLYSAATCFVFPSIYEGFGLPVLEAMASGTPVICSNATSLPEVVGNAALMHDPEDVDALTGYIKSMIYDDAQYHSMIDRGINQSGLFSWSHCADKTIEAYEQVANFL